MPQNTPRSDSEAGTRLSLATAGSAILLASFFLPWINFMGTPVAGFRIREIWSVGPYLWAIPVVALVAILVELSGRKSAGIGQLAGALPFVFLAIAIYQFGADLFKGLAVGGWMTLISAVFLMAVADRASRGMPQGTPAAVRGEPTSTHENQ